MSDFTPRKFRAKIDEHGLEDAPDFSMTFPVQSLRKGKIYEERNPEYLSTKQKGIVIDDNSCWWQYGTAEFDKRFELVEWKLI